MDEIHEVLKDLGLQSFIENFKKEKIEAHMIESLSDCDLTRLGIQTIGDRHRFRQHFRSRSTRPSASAGPSSASGTASTESGATRNSITEVREFRNTLFRPGSRNLQTSKKSSKRGKKIHTWTTKFIALANKDACNVPVSGEREILRKAGLGAKKITLDVDDGEEEVLQKVMSGEKNDDGVTIGFPKLKEAGGVEFLRTNQNCRSLKILDCPWTVKDLKSVISAQTNIYLRPIQRDLSLEPVDDTDTSSQSAAVQMEECKWCKKTFNLRSLRAHLEMCSDSTVSMETYDTTNETVIHVHVPEEQVNNNPIFSLENGIDLDTLSVSVGNSIDHVDVAQLEQYIGNAEENFQEIEVHENQPQENEEKADSENEDTVKNIVKRVVTFCKENSIDDPVEILRKLQKEILVGRKLDVTDESEILQGDTNFVSIDRDNVLQTAVEEIASIPEEELRKCLEINFYGEMAVDLGGPRKEFFKLVLRAIKEKYFDNGWRELRYEEYECVGKILALSILQNGPIPQFIFGENFFGENNICLTYLSRGLNTLGIVEAVQQLPTLKHIFHQSEVKLTVKRLLHLLQPKFSYAGSNKEKYEKAVYSAFVKYVRAVAGGQRGALSLESILLFTTGSTSEPLLGFQLAPSIEFAECQSFLPIANTCVNRLTLPRPSAFATLPGEAILYELYDYAFSNTFFGIK